MVRVCICDSALVINIIMYAIIHVVHEVHFDDEIGTKKDKTLDSITVSGSRPNG